MLTLISSLTLTFVSEKKVLPKFLKNKDLYAYKEKSPIPLVKPMPILGFLKHTDHVQTTVILMWMILTMKTVITIRIEDDNKI